MNAARWVLVGILAGGSVAFFAGCILGWLNGYDHGRAGGAREAKQWERQCDDYEVELAKADATIAQLNQNIGVVYDAGVVAGQTFQADRQENGL